jgi:hypothetical protein
MDTEILGGLRDKGLTIARLKRLRIGILELRFETR